MKFHKCIPPIFSSFRYKAPARISDRNYGTSDFPDLHQLSHFL